MERKIRYILYHKWVFWQTYIFSHCLSTPKIKRQTQVLDLTKGPFINYEFQPEEGPERTVNSWGKLQGYLSPISRFLMGKSHAPSLSNPQTVCTQPAKTRSSASHQTSKLSELGQPVARSGPVDTPHHGKRISGSKLLWRCTKSTPCAYRELTKADFPFCTSTMWPI